jgi:DNA polymerase-3 subunit alpha
MAKQRERFVEGAVKGKIDADKAGEIFDQMETFARYGFNKSHSAAYALVSYQTAYLKTHYPVEFMAGLLTSEMGDTDKVIKNLAECREKNIEVLPPDINESSADFTPVGEKIRFGLAAVKNVGEKAVEVILQSRAEEGPFKSIFDFCRRVDLTAVNRRVLESLIKCGAFDSTGTARERMLAALDEAMRIGQAHQKNRESNQIDLFGLSGGSSNGFGGANGFHDAYPNAEEWTAQQKLTHEKESLGFYITGHPLDKYEGRLARLTSGSAAVLKERAAPGEVKAGGVVTAMRLKNTKKGDRYASFQLEDKTGFIEVIVWPETYKRCGETLVSDDPILVAGKIDIGEERVQIIANEIIPLEEASRRLPPARKKDNGGRVHVYLRGTALSSEELAQLHETLRRHPGSSPVSLHFFASDQSEQIIETDELRIASNPELLAVVEQLFGDRVSVSPGPS